VTTDPDVVASFEEDWTGRWRGRAACVVRPRSTDEVVAVVRACAAHGVAIVPQGGNTGLVGGSVPRAGEVVLSLRRLDAVEPVDAAAAEIVVGAGATLAAVQSVARAAGLEFAVDIAPRASCTIGGMIATNAGGAHVIRFGMMAEQVIGVEAVCADGSVVGRVPDLRKNNAGYHLGALLAGSEGTLAVITRAHLRLVPALPERAVALVGVPGAAEAVQAIAALRRLPSLVALEIAFAEAIDLACRFARTECPLSAGFGAALLAECAGRTSPLEELADAVTALGALALDAAVATDASGIARLWALREGIPDAIRAEGVPHKLDVAVPVARIPEFERAVRERVASLAPGARVVVFGHAGDGNLHVNVLGLAADDEAVDDAVLRLAADLGGSIAAEHGVGVAKVRALALTRSAADRAALRSLKRAFDPAGLLNPGVAVPPD